MRRRVALEDAGRRGPDPCLSARPSPFHLRLQPRESHDMSADRPRLSPAMSPLHRRGSKGLLPAGYWSCPGMSLPHCAQTVGSRSMVHGGARNSTALAAPPPEAAVAEISKFFPRPQTGVHQHGKQYHHGHLIPPGWQIAEA